MSTRLQELTTEALTLPRDDRVKLAQRLWESIEDSSDEISAEEAERLAVREALRRNAEMSAGLVEGIPHEQVMAAARRAIGCS